MKFLKMLPQYFAVGILLLLFACQWDEEEKKPEPPPPEKKKSSLFDEPENKKKSDSQENSADIKSDTVKALDNVPDKTAKPSFDNLANAQKEIKPENIAPFYEKYLK